MVNNQLKTILLLGILTGILLLIGSFFGSNGIIIAAIFVLIMNVGSYWFSDKIILFMYRAKEVKEKDEPRLFKIIKEVKDSAGVPMPKVYIIPSEASNAFATGRNKEHSAVAVTHGIMKLLNDEELKGVLAHEFAHIKNRDILIQTVASTIAGIISSLAFMARWGIIFGGGRDDDNSAGILELLALAIIAPIAAAMIQLAISRSREYIADETGVRIAKNSKGLIRALEKLHDESKHKPLQFGTQATENLFIVNPFSGRRLITLFSTHPHVEDRVKRLKELKI